MLPLCVRAYGIWRAMRPFVRLIAAYFINGLANGIPATLFLYFVSRAARRGGACAGRCCSSISWPASRVSRWPCGWRPRSGKHRAWCLAMIVNCAIFALVPFLSAGDVWPFRRDLR